MITRTVGRILRGKATPFQLFTACVLGAMLGFIPGFAQAPGMMIAVMLLLAILNANLFLGAIVASLSKLLSLLILPITFKVGQLLLDGPTQGLFEPLINAPVFALFGFENYVATGGLALGLIVGLVAGSVVVFGINTFRKRMAALEKGSERFNQFTQKRWVKFMVLVFVGGGLGKLTYEQVLAKKVGNPIRMLGVVFAALVVVLLVLLQSFAAGPIVSAALQRGLERANGASVDLEGVDVDLKGQRLTITGLAMTDPKALDTDLFRADKLEAQISGANLLRKRLQLDRVIVSGASSGDKRAHPGRLVGPPPAPLDPEPVGDAKTLDDYLREAKVWKERLAQARRWLEQLSGPAETATETEQQETLQDRLERQARELGYSRVRATHLIQGSPTFTILELTADQVRTTELPNETLAITARNLSTHPSLLGQTPELRIESSGQTVQFATQLASFATTPSANTLSLNYRGLPTDRVAAGLVVGGTRPISGGTIDLALQGTWEIQNGVQVNLPLQATLKQVTFSLPSVQPTLVDQLILPIGLAGPLDNPRIRVDEKAFADALVKAGAGKLVNELRGKAEETLTREVGDKLGEQGKGLLNNILGGQKRTNN
ncbi:MAG: DUF2062 domain-containing protein [Verrucomicrobia bacterium]|nr:DUF2062 domain-containing protein [Verrucomicrobiota bacterium]